MLKYRSIINLCLIIFERNILKQTTKFFLIFFIAGSINLLAQNTYYVSPNGNDSNDGSINKPFKTIDKGLSSLDSNNGTVFLRKGIYYFDASLNLNKNGNQKHYINIYAFKNEKPVLDFTGAKGNGIIISGSYYHLKGIQEKNAERSGIYITGNNNIVENCSIHENKYIGLNIAGAEASNNLILNCDSYFNYDPDKNGEDADGFGARHEVGKGNVFRGCRAWNNSDDGWDLWMADNTITIDSCYAFRNGINFWQDKNFQGDGNGFKLGGKNVPCPHILKNCVAFDNTATGRGFDENNNTAGQTLYNCTAFRNKGANFKFDNDVVQGQHVFKNCISFEGNVSIKSGIQGKNSWQGFNVSDKDFISTDTTGVLTPRNNDGTLPRSNFLRLSPNSSLIDMGADVGIPFKGKAPDLGAFEMIKK